MVLSRSWKKKDQGGWACF